MRLSFLAECAAMEDTSSSPRKAFQVHDPAWYQELSQRDQIFARANRRAKRLGPGNPSPPWKHFSEGSIRRGQEVYFQPFSPVNWIGWNFRSALPILERTILTVLCAAWP